MSASGIQNLGLWNPEYPRLCWALLNPLNYVGGFVSEILAKRNKKESQFQKDHTLEISLFRSSLQARKKFQQLTVFLQLKAGQSVALFISLSLFLSKNNNFHVHITFLQRSQWCLSSDVPWVPEAFRARFAVSVQS